MLWHWKTRVRTWKVWKGSSHPWRLAMTESPTDYYQIRSISASPFQTLLWMLQTMKQIQNSRTTGSLKNSQARVCQVKFNPREREREVVGWCESEKRTSEVRWGHSLSDYYYYRFYTHNHFHCFTPTPSYLLYSSLPFVFVFIHS